MVNCTRCSVELVKLENCTLGQYERKICRSCEKKLNAKKNPIYSPKWGPIQNPLRMYVDGKYISRSHPLYKPGRYKTFNDAAFSSLENYNKSPEGEVYIVQNPAWKDWYKVGKAVDSKDRCNGYQTSSPHRDYNLLTYVSVSDRSVAERKMHKIVEGICEKRSNEWFYVKDLTKDTLDKLLEMLND